MAAAAYEHVAVDKRMENSILYGLVQFEVLFKGTTIASFVVWQCITTAICRNRVTRAAVEVAV